jgi:predicted DNA-binding transcriptional regulator AlpA
MPLQCTSFAGGGHEAAPNPNNRSQRKKSLRSVEAITPGFGARVCKGDCMNAPARASTIDPLLNPRDAATILGVSTSWLAKSRLSGEGPRFVKLGRAVRYLESSLREYIKARTRGSTSEQ